MIGMIMNGPQFHLQLRSLQEGCGDERCHPTHPIPSVVHGGWTRLVCYHHGKTGMHT